MTIGFCVMNLRSEDPFWSKNVDISKTRTWTFSSEMLNEQRIFKKRSALMSFEKSSWKKNIFFEKTEIYGENGQFFLESWDFFLRKLTRFRINWEFSAAEKFLV